MSRHALRITTPGAADEDIRTALEEAGFTLTVAADVDDLDITPPDGTGFEAIVVGSAALSSQDSLRSQIRLLRLVSDHLTPDGIALVVADVLGPGPRHDRTEARHGANVHITEELDLIAEMAGLRRVYRSNSGEETQQAATVSLYRRKRS